MNDMSDNRTYGHFDDKAREFVITDPELPLAVDKLSGHGGFLFVDFSHCRRLLFLQGRQIQAYPALQV